MNLYWPDGIARDRERTRKALKVIGSDPVWYVGVMAGRMWGLLKYAGDDSGIYGSTGVNITPSKTLPPSWRYFPLTAVATALGWAQSVLRYLLLPLMLLGIWMAARQDWRMTLLILATVFYYLIFGTFLHSEIRYSLPMQSLLFVFAGVAVSWIVSKLPLRHRPLVKDDGN